MLFYSVRKGEQTRKKIVGRALALVGEVGLDGLSIGALAEEAKLSKSGLFAHFKSKEALQIGVLQATIDRFTDQVIRPALAAPRGEPRLRLLFEKNSTGSAAAKAAAGASSRSWRASTPTDRDPFETVWPRR